MIRALVTGFGPFPGAPENPTAALMQRLAAAPPRWPGVELAIETIPTEYAGLPGVLARLGAEARPDVAVHFGLAKKAHGFRLERLARNRANAGREDAAGGRPASAVLAEGEADRASTLPLDRIAATLQAAALPWEWSEDCGDYLCNALFFHAAAGLVPAFRPAMAGFVHVPLPGERFTAGDLERGARLILEECVAACAAQRRTAAPLSAS
jgi:pyroglutamyl-peptidase